MQSAWRAIVLPLCLIGMVLSAGCNKPTPAMKASKIEPSASTQKSDGPKTPSNLFRHDKGNATAGRDVYRFETFGNEGFWTDAMRLPQGVLEAKFTPIQALKRVGPVFGSRFQIPPWGRQSTGIGSVREPRRTARDAAAIRGTSSKMVHRRPACATVSTQPR